MTNAAQRAQRALWTATPLKETFYVVFYRLRCPSGRVIRKYLSAGGRGFTENRFNAWKTTSREEAERRAANLEGGRVAEFKP